MFSIPVLDGLVVGLKGESLTQMCTVFERHNKGWARQDGSGTAGNQIRVSHQSFVQSLWNRIAYSTSILQQQLHPATTSRVDIPRGHTFSAVPDQEVTDAVADEPALILRSVRLVVPRDHWPHACNCRTLQSGEKEPGRAM